MSERDWQPIDQHPVEPMPVVFFAARVRFFSFPKGRGIDDPVIRQPDHSRGEACDIGYWTGTAWVYSGSNHDVFEFEGDEQDNGKPTHWMPLPQPPSIEE